MATPRPDGVFVSSVYNELKAYREAALNAIWRCDLYPVGMEREDIAKPETTSASSFAMIDESSVYIGIFAHRLGVVTRKELRYAQQKAGMPILIFLAEKQLNDEDVELNQDHARELEALKAELKRDHVTATFATVAELSEKVFRSLMDLCVKGTLTPRETAASPHRRMTEGEALPTTQRPSY